MCLFISTKAHHEKDGVYKAKKVGKKPILVWKLLEYNECIQGYATPYQYTPVNFKNGFRCVNGYGFSPKAYGTERARVCKGTHAYRTEKRAVEGIANALEYDWVFKKFPAVIPSGEQYFVGQDGDIVASQMIIFKSKRGLNKYLDGKETITIE